MTSPTLPESVQHNIEGRSVRDVVEYSPEQVDDAWCRKILRKILQSLELQYAMQMPHRAITPDTIVFHANGEPLLISDDIDAAPAPDSHLADDLTALACVIHYAITQELVPAGPLDGRVDGYSAALVATVDACMNPEPARRPESVDAVRGLLGIAASAPRAGIIKLSGPPTRRDLSADAAIVAAATALAPTSDSVRTGAAGAAVAASAHVPDAPVPSATSTASALPPARVAAPVDDAPPDAPVDLHHLGRGRGWRWTMAAGGGAIAIALAVLLFPRLRNAGSTEHVALPQTSTGVRPGVPAPGSAAADVARRAETKQAPIDAPGASNSVPARDPAGAMAGAGKLPVVPDSSLAVSPASGASAGGTTHSGDDGDPPEDTGRAAPKPASAIASVAATVPPGASRRGVTPVKGEADGVAAAPPRAVSGNAIYQLQIKPWGVVYVDGVDRGVSPPVKRLALTPGRHTVRITNPKYSDSVLEFESAQTTSNGKIIVDFDHAAR